MRAALLSLFVIIAFAVPQTPNSQTLHSGEDVSLRGLSASEDGKIFWATGNKGTILRSSDAGTTWTNLHIDNAADADFRGVSAFGADIAYVFSVGNDNKSHIYKTTDAGKTWHVQYSDPRAAFFLDGLACRTEKNCFAISDPIDGKFPILHTEDGERWAELSATSEPSAIPTEGLFAASNTSLILCGPNQNDIFFATGGPAARIFHSADNAQTWSVVTTPILSGNATAGIFSIACYDRTLLAVGGDYRDPTATKSVAAYSSDLGATWRLADKPPAGYRSAVTSLGPEYPNVWITVGTTGADISVDFGARWDSLNRENANAALTIAPGLVLTVGPKAATNQIHFAKRDQH